MIAVIFELEAMPDQKQKYFEMAAELKPLLCGIDGFVSIERFQSLVNDKKFLSLSFWRDEGAVTAWRNCGEHRQAQQQGRDSIFKHYRLRVAEIQRDYSMLEREQVPSDTQAGIVRLA